MWPLWYALLLLDASSRSVFVTTGMCAIVIFSTFVQQCICNYVAIVICYPLIACKGTSVFVIMCAIVGTTSYAKGTVYCVCVYYCM